MILSSAAALARSATAPPASLTPAQRRLMVWRRQLCDSAVAAGRGAACAHAAVSAIIVAERASCLSSPRPFLRLFCAVRGHAMPC